MKIIFAATLMLSFVCIYGRRMPTQNEFDDELRKAFEDEVALDAPLVISKGEEGSLDAFPFKQDEIDVLSHGEHMNLLAPVEEGSLEATQFKRAACADITSTNICIIFTHHCQSTKEPGTYMRTNCRQSCGLC